MDTEKGNDMTKLVMVGMAMGVALMLTFAAGVGVGWLAFHRPAPPQSQPMQFHPTQGYPIIRF